MNKYQIVIQRGEETTEYLKELKREGRLLLYLSTREDQILSMRIEEAIIASCKTGSVGFSGREEEGCGVEREKEFEAGVDANHRRFAGGTGSLEERMGEDTKDLEREGSAGVMKGFANFGVDWLVGEGNAGEGAWGWRDFRSIVAGILRSARLATHNLPENLQEHCACS